MSRPAWHARPERRPDVRQAGSRAAGSIGRGPPVRHGQRPLRRGPRGRPAALAQPPRQRPTRPAPPPARLVDRANRAPARPRARDRARLPARPDRRQGQGAQSQLCGNLRALRRTDLGRRRQGSRFAALSALQTAVTRALDPRNGPRRAPLLARALRLYRLLARLVGHARAPARRRRARPVPRGALALAVGHPPALRHARGSTRRRLRARSDPRQAADPRVWVSRTATANPRRPWRTTRKRAGPTGGA